MIPPIPIYGPRGCGNSRVAGGLYAELPLGPGGRPVEDFLICPPRLLNFDVPVRGQLPVEINGTLHLVDWIGSEFYPNVADFVEEVRYMGLSRRIAPVLATSRDDSKPASFVLEKLTRDSRILCVHAHAWLHNYEHYAPFDFLCPRHHESHPHNTPMCGGVWWWDVTGGEPAPVPEHVCVVASERLVERSMPSFRYYARTRPDGVEPVYSPAIFAAFPIARFALVAGSHGEHEPMADKLLKLDMDIPWAIVPR